MYFKLAKVHCQHEVLIPHQTSLPLSLLKFPSFTKYITGWCPFTCKTVVNCVTLYIM